MATTPKITVFELIEKYLTGIGVSKSVASIKLLPAKFEPIIYRVSLAKSNIVLNNKNGSGSHETHIAVAKPKWSLFFSATDITDYETTGNSHEALQSFEFFEANIADMLTRRAATASPFLKTTATARGIYAVNDNILSGSADKWISSNNGSTQVRLSQSAKDSTSFSDFRLGIQIGDVLVMLKDKYAGDILAVSIPSSFANRYSISTVSASKHASSSAVKAAKAVEQNEDDKYVNATEDSVEIKLPAGPQPPVKASAGAKGKTYKATPGIGKNALKSAGYICACDPLHTTFTARSTGHAYMEPHHLVPISKQGLFSAGLDVPENIICLCPTCHSKIHYGEKADIKNMLHSLFAGRTASLATRGITLTESELYALYDL